jgi:carotenoid cleavage dioxygenase-like enzyme
MQYNFVADIGATTVYSLFVVPDEGEARVLCKIPVAKASYLHSFALTENYFILQVLPSLTLAPQSIVSGVLIKRSLSSPRFGRCLSMDSNCSGTSL